MGELFTITYRGGAVVLFEKAAQVVAVAEAVGGGDFVQGQIGFFQLLFGAREAEQIAVFNGRNSNGIFEFVGKIGYTHSVFPGKFCKIYLAFGVGFQFFNQRKQAVVNC